MNRLARFAGFGRNQQSTDSSDAAATDVKAADDASTDQYPVERMDAEELREPIIASLRQVHDPEIPVNIYDLGLIYNIDIATNGDVDVDMTLTAPGCPVAGMMPMMVKNAVEKVEGVGQVQVELVWDPPWTQDNMSEEALLQLGMM
ncbi:SUF system Fe-S cluster assembly protein [Rhabdochromatium marinum]|uniref:SUF system Fe-S cluster assembly protein n=1 Tax=Rhabdochromatium marinum TaxID=48729 RepID=UPI001904BC67|nr:SUF system Fe-S cluster assembly protein [Rhabdochromatium marinum]MBK1647219.1 SUF system Fe-S cluster assembly protein [Rhabdochromatium marinum]